MLRRVPGVCCTGPRILLQSTLSSSVTSFLKELITWDKNFSFQVSAFVSFNNPFGSSAAVLLWWRPYLIFVGAATHSLPVASLAESSSTPLPVSRSSASVPRHHRQGQPGKDLTQARANSSAVSRCFRILENGSCTSSSGMRRARET